MSESRAGFDRMGSPIPYEARQAAYEAAQSMGLSRTEAFECIDVMSEQLRRDKPYEAQQCGMNHVDLTGTYRLMATLLAAPEPDPEKNDG